ncbi:MAG: glycyl radical protein [Bacteroidales bacterium]|nr:glycyl radical protein [Bacteroidales bacterium]
MNERVKKLREQSLNAVNKISVERALLVTEFYRSIEGKELPVPVQRARCLYHILDKKNICINPGELIVGERGPAPKATPTYPEISLHSLEDLRILNSRQKVSFKVDKDTTDAYVKTIIPFWKGKSNRDIIMRLLPQHWHDAYDAGIFTEFQEQRAPGHSVCGNKIYRLGMLDIIEQIKAQTAILKSETESVTDSQLAELEAMKIAAEAIIRFAQRHASCLKELAKAEKDQDRKNELLKMADVCQKVPAHAPENFHEALQYYWFVHLGVITELNPWDSYNPGRLDQHLYPFYKKGLEAGSLTKEGAVELLQCFWVKFNNHPAPPKVGVTALESNTYTDFALINLGGLTENGRDAVNELTYIILDVIEEMRLLQPSSMVQVSKQNPDAFVKRALKIIKTGFGQPSIFNTDAIIQELLRQGKSIQDARNGGASGCVETGAFGTESYILTGYFNLTKIFELTLHNGFDVRTGKQVGLNTGKVKEFNDFSTLMEAFEKQVRYFAGIKIEGNLIIEKQFAHNMPVPFLSLLVDDCIGNACDYNAGGARYNTSYIQGVGLGTLTDCLTAVKYHIYDKKKLGWENLCYALSENFVDFEDLRKDLIYNTPKYGNDDDYADDQAVQIFEIFSKAVEGIPTYRGGTFRINMLPTTSHVYFGSVTGATPDGRLEGQPLSEGISPVQGADRQGPSAVIKSASKFDHIRTGGTLLNQKFTPAFFSSEEALGKLCSLVRTYFRMDGHHIQFNVVSADTLRKAQKNPELYSDLIVRVAGYSDYFNDLGEDLQNEIIKRTEHESI